jgi:hypothetical protein
MYFNNAIKNIWVPRGVTRCFINLIHKVGICKDYYEESYMLKPHCPATKTLKQLIYNYNTTRAWKYRQLIDKMSSQKIKELYCSCNLVTN